MDNKQVTMKVQQGQKKRLKILAKKQKRTMMATLDILLDAWEQEGGKRLAE